MIKIWNCRLSKGEHNNFLQFEFVEYDSEYNQLNIRKEQIYNERKEQAKVLKVEGLNNTQIAEKYNVTEGAVRK